MSLPSPVAIAANTTYVASYHSTPGYYVETIGYFTSAVTNGLLTALADGTDGRKRRVPVRSLRFPDAELEAAPTTGSTSSSA